LEIKAYSEVRRIDFTQFEVDALVKMSREWVNGMNEEIERNRRLQEEAS